MKLVEILARELDKWPSSPNGNDGITQDKGKSLSTLDSGCKPSLHKKDGVWEAKSHSYYFDFRPTVLASDYRTSVVTREMWQAEREKLKPKKANADGWVRHRGGKCPVEAGVLVDVRHRDGGIYEAELAGALRGHAVTWIHHKHRGDIMAYRIHKPTEQPAEQEWIDLPVKIQTPEEKVDTILEVRDRIREIDRTVEALEEERVSLIQRLEGEGLQLLQGNLCGSARPALRWDEWLKGDRLECVEKGGGLELGKVYTYTGDNDNDGENTLVGILEIGRRCFQRRLKFQSRPSA